MADLTDNVRSWVKSRHRFYVTIEWLLLAQSGRSRNERCGTCYSAPSPRVSTAVPRPLSSGERAEQRLSGRSACDRKHKLHTLLVAAAERSAVPCSSARCSLSLPDVSHRYCGKDVQWAPVLRRSFPVAILGLARPRDCADSTRLQDGNEHHEAQRSDAKREDTQNLFHIGSYAFSISG